MCRLSSECIWLQESIISGKITHSDIVVCSYIGSDDVACCLENTHARYVDTHYSSVHSHVAFFTRGSHIIKYGNEPATSFQEFFGNTLII